MKNYTLNPFLSSLAEQGISVGIRDYERIRLMLQSGGDWTLGRLGNVLQSLLVKDREQQEIFRRHFDEFFKPEPGEEKAFEDIDVDRALKDLKLLARTRNIFPKFKHKTVGKKIGIHRDRFGVPAALFAALIFITAGMLLYFHIPDFEVGFEVRAQRSEVAETGPNPLPPSPNLIPRTSFELSLLFLLSALWIYLRKIHRVPVDKAPVWNEEGPRCFSPESIGGKRPALLPETVLDQVAESLGYFKSGPSDSDLNMKASAESTARNSGIPTLIFENRRQIRSLLIIEDIFAEASAWNPIIVELLRGMSLRGIPTVHARFTGSPKTFSLSDRSVCRIEDWENRPEEFLMLIFTDGKGVCRPEGTFVPELSARRSHAAWMELREPRFWDQTVSVPIRYGIPVYPASPEGILKAVTDSVSEQGKNRNYAEMIRVSENLSGMKGEVCAEMLLGDSLLWAADCSLMPVFGQGLAHALRLRFHPHLPPERIGRIFALPGTVENISGIRFSPQTSRILRKAFIARREEHEQDAVLDFLSEKIAEAEPEEKDSLSHLKWEAIRERIRFERDKDGNLKRLSELSLSPVGGFVRSLFDGFGFPEDQDKIPLRFKPKNREALQRLPRIAKNFRIRKAPLSYGYKIALGVSIALFLIFFGYAANTGMNSSNREIPGYESQISGSSAAAR